MKKVSDNLGYVGLGALLGALFYYSVNQVWDWKAQVAFYGGLGLVAFYLALHWRAVRSLAGSRAMRYGGAAGAGTLMVLAILVLLNFLNFRHHARLDLTENHLYSLSDQSRKVVAGLQNDVHVLGFFRDEGGRVAFEDLMKEYHFASPRVAYEVVDPEADPSKTAQYEIRLNGQVVVESGPKRETVDKATEEKITNAIIKVTRKEEKTVYFLVGHGERGTDDTSPRGFSGIREAVEKQNYKVKTYNLAQQNKLPTDATLMVSAGPRVDFFPNEVKLLEEYLARGGKLLLMVDPESKFRMKDFLAAYGLELGGKVVIDASGLGRIFGLGAGAPLVAQYPSHPITKDLHGVMTFFPMAQNLKTTKSSLGYTTTKLAETSSRSWAESDLGQGEVQFDAKVDEKGPVTIALVATHKVEPEKEKGKKEEKEEKGKKEETKKQPEKEEATSRESRLVLFGDSDFPSNQYLSGGANADLFLMTVGWLAEESDLMALRPRNPENRRIELTFRESRLLFWGTVILLPLLTLVLGVSVWYRRK